MKILISCDMEGTCGVVHFNQVLPPEMASFGELRHSPDYDWARRLLTQEVNAAVEGAFEAGAQEVYVNESHDGMRNIIPELLHREAKLINGSDKPLSMVQGADLGVDGIIYTGYHAAANTPGAVLAHTYSLSVQAVRLNGVRMGEGGVNAAVAGTYNVPVIMVSGDDKVVAEIKGLLGKKVVGVVVKQGISRSSAIQLHPEKARELIRAGACQAVRQVKEYQPYRLTAPICMELDLINPTQADRAEMLPGVKRTGPMSVSYTANEMPEIWQAFSVLLKLTNPQH